MTGEISSVSFGGNQYSDWDSAVTENHGNGDLHGRIFRDSSNGNILSKNVTSRAVLNHVEQKTKNTALVSPMGYSAEGKFTVEWGGSEGVTASGSASASVSDDNGNKAEAEVTADSDGSGSASISVSHNED